MMYAHFQAMEQFQTHIPAQNEWNIYPLGTDI